MQVLKTLKRVMPFLITNRCADNGERSPGESRGSSLSLRGGRPVRRAGAGSPAHLPARRGNGAHILMTGGGFIAILSAAEPLHHPCPAHEPHSGAGGDHCPFLPPSHGPDGQRVQLRGPHRQRGVARSAGAAAERGPRADARILRGGRWIVQRSYDIINGRDRPAAAEAARPVRPVWEEMR